MALFNFGKKKEEKKETGCYLCSKNLILTLISRIHSREDGSLSIIYYFVISHRNDGNRYVAHCHFGLFNHSIHSFTFRT